MMPSEKLVCRKKTKQAAEEVANYESRLGKSETDLAVLKWMVGFNLIMTASLLFKAFA